MSLGAGDHEAACELLSAPQRERKISGEESLASQEDRPSRGCAGGLEYSFLPGPISQPEVDDVSETDTAVEVYLTRDAAETGLRAQMVREDGTWRVDEYGTATKPVSTEPVCADDAAAGEKSDLPDPEAAWLTDFREGYYVDLADDRVVTSSGAYTQVLVDALEECGMTPETFEELVKAVAAASPTSLDAPSAFDFTSFGGDPLFTCQLANVAANTYEVTSCAAIDFEGS